MKRMNQMKRIFFCLEKGPGLLNKLKIKIKMRLRFVSVNFNKFDNFSFAEKETLIITDNAGDYEKIKARGLDALILIEETGEIDNFKNARYFIMNPYNTEYAYFKGTFDRFNNIPWEPVKTKRLILRETVESDVDVFYEMYKDPEMTRFTESLYEDIEEEKKYVKEYREKVYEIQGFGIWTVIRKKDKRIIGRAGLITRAGFSEPEVGYAIGTSYQRQGYATEAIKGILKFAKENGFEKVNALVMKENEASEKLLQKIGFKAAGNTRIGCINYDVWQI